MTKQRLLGLMMSFCFAMFTFAQSGNGERPILKGYKGSVKLGLDVGADDAGENIIIHRGKRSLICLFRSTMRIMLSAKNSKGKSQRELNKYATI